MLTTGGGICGGIWMGVDFLEFFCYLFIAVHSRAHCVQNAEYTYNKYVCLGHFK